MVKNIPAVPQGLVLDRLHLVFDEALLHTVAELHINKTVAADSLNDTCAFRSANHILKVDGLINLLQALSGVVPFLLSFFWVCLVVLFSYPFSRTL